MALEKSYNALPRSDKQKFTGLKDLMNILDTHSQIKKNNENQTLSESLIQSIQDLMKILLKNLDKEDSLVKEVQQNMLSYSWDQHSQEELEFLQSEISVAIEACNNNQCSVKDIQKMLRNLIHQSVSSVKK